MSLPIWRDVLVDVELHATDKAKLEQIQRTAESFADTLTYGMSAIGYLLACTASNGDTGLDPDEAAATGWLLSYLANLVTELNNKKGHAADLLRPAPGEE